MKLSDLMFAWVILVVIMVFNDHICDFGSKVKNIFVCHDRQNYGKAYREYNGPVHRYTGRLDKKDLIPFNPFPKNKKDSI